MSSLARGERRLESYLLALDERCHVDVDLVVGRRVPNVELYCRGARLVGTYRGGPGRLALVQGAIVDGQVDIRVRHRLPFAQELERHGQVISPGRAGIRDGRLGAGKTLSTD